MRELGVNTRSHDFQVEKQPSFAADRRPGLFTLPPLLTDAALDADEGTRKAPSAPERDSLLHSICEARNSRTSREGILRFLRECASASLGSWLRLSRGAAALVMGIHGEMFSGEPLGTWE